MATTKGRHEGSARGEDEVRQRRLRRSQRKRSLRAVPDDFRVQLTRVEMVRRTVAGRTRETDQLAREEPLEIRLGGQSIAVTMRTPGHDEELAAGFLLTEGIVQRASEITGILRPDENALNVLLAPSVKVDFERLTRHVFASSSCGVCGKATIESVQQRFPPIESPFVVATETLLLLPERLRTAQKVFDQTGGLHAAAIFDHSGKLIVSREDVGRHNAVDKVIGYGLLNNQPPFDQHVLLVSGRASFEIVQKALAARIPVVAAVSAPSSLAVEFAEENGQALIGFLRPPSLNVYCHPERVRGVD